MALDVALGTAAAMGDERCGTEYLLFGVVATASGDLAELCEIFALDTRRVERAIQSLRGHRFEPREEGHPDPPLSARVELAIHSPSLSGDVRRTGFDLLVGCLDDPRSGAATVLRHLGVRLGEIRRLAELGAARLDRDEVEQLIAALDRRRDLHSSWWGPAAHAPVARIGTTEVRPRVIARSDTAEVTLDTVVVGTDGFGFSLTLTSLGAWVLPPAWEPIEHLTPGVGAEHRMAPEVVTVGLTYEDGTRLSNHRGGPRFRTDLPHPGTLVRLSTRTVVEDRNDRRRAVRHTVTTEWWAWPLPIGGEIELDVHWPAEAVDGRLRLDGDAIVSRAAALPAVR